MRHGSLSLSLSLICLAYIVCIGFEIQLSHLFITTPHTHISYLIHYMPLWKAGVEPMTPRLYFTNLLTIGTQSLNLSIPLLLNSLEYIVECTGRTHDPPIFLFFTNLLTIVCRWLGTQSIPLLIILIH